MTSIDGLDWRWPILVPLFALFALFHFLWGKFYIGYSLSQAQIIPIIKSIHDPSLFSEDFMVLTKDGYHTIYTYIVAWLMGPFGDFELPIFLLHILSVIFCFYFSFQICRLIFSSSSLSLIFCFVMPLQFAMLYGYQAKWRTIFIHPNHNTIGLAFMLGSFYFLLRNREKMAFALLAAGAYFHSLSTYHFFILLMLWNSVRLFFGWKSGRSLRINNFGKVSSYTLFLLLILPLLVQQLSVSNTFDDASWRTFRAINFYESFPLSWPPDVFINFSAFFLLAIFCWHMLKEQSASRHLSIIFGFICGSVFLSVLGLIGVEALNSGTVLLAQLSRATIWAHYFGSMLIVAYLYFSFRMTMLNLLAVLIIAISIFYQGWFTFLACPLFSIAHIILLFNHRAAGYRWHRSFIIYATLQVMLIGFYLSNLNISVFLDGVSIDFEQISESLHPLLCVISILAVVALIFWRTKMNEWSQRIQIFVVVGVWACLGLAMSLLFLNRQLCLTSSQKNWFDLQKWASEKTQPQDKFLIPLGLVGFRNFSDRMPLVEWQDGTQQYFSGAIGALYRERLRDLGFDGEKKLSSQDLGYYNWLPDEKLIFLREKYGVLYYVQMKRHPLRKSFNLKWRDLKDKPTYENEYFVVTKLSYL